ncbi:hypothetical protein C8R47DRAFT_1229064 [Mycena vitilis]|nr:hypothetical protein C8R47DRAFT_1229064 [Mycena vitilis]
MDELLAKLQSLNPVGQAAADNLPVNEALQDAPPGTGLPGRGQLETTREMENLARAHFERLEKKDKEVRQEAKEAMERTFLRWQHGVRFTPSNFESVSIIPFANIDELSGKLESLQPGRKAAVDNSPTNKAFQDAALGIGRGQFENSRYVLNPPGSSSTPITRNARQLEMLDRLFYQVL